MICDLVRCSFTNMSVRNLSWFSDTRIIILWGLVTIHINIRVYYNASIFCEKFLNKYYNSVQPWYNASVDSY